MKNTTMTTNESTTHTPGPWEISKYGDGGMIVATTDDEAALCQVFGTAQPEYAANARLIAAAPELLAALQSAVAYLEAYRPQGKIRDIFTQLNAHENGALKPALAAIAKATGQE